MATKEEIIAVLDRRDNVGMHAVGRALVHLYNRQTMDEKLREETRHTNNVGFTKGDGKRGVGMANFYMRAGFLTVKQVAYWQTKPGNSHSRIGKYWGQLLDEANKKAQAKKEAA